MKTVQWCACLVVVVGVAAMTVTSLTSKQQASAMQPAVASSEQTTVFDGVNAGNIETVQARLGQLQSVDITDNDGMTPLHRAAVKGFVEIGQLLIRHGASVTRQDERGWTPLHIAAMRGHEAMVAMLLQSGANPSVKDKMGKTPYDWAARFQHSNIMHLLNTNQPTTKE